VQLCPLPLLLFHLKNSHTGFYHSQRVLNNDYEVDDEAGSDRFRVQLRRLLLLLFHVWTSRADIEHYSG